jgi:hypothetical protein
MDLIHLAIAILAILVVVRAGQRLVHRGRSDRRWLAVPPHYVIREDRDRPRWRRHLGAALWLALAGGLLLLTLLVGR